MLTCNVPNVCVIILCVGWYLLGVKIGGNNSKSEEVK